MNPISSLRLQDLPGDPLRVVAAGLSDKHRSFGDRERDLISLACTSRHFNQILDVYQILTEHERSVYQLSLVNQWSCPVLRILDVAERHAKVVDKRSLALSLMYAPNDHNRLSDKGAAVLMLNRAGSNLNNDAQDFWMRRARNSRVASLEKLSTQGWEVFKGQATDLQIFIDDCIGISAAAGANEDLRFTYFADDCFAVLNQLPAGLKTLAFIRMCSNFSTLAGSDVKEKKYAGFLISLEIASLMPETWGPHLYKLSSNGKCFFSASEDFLKFKPIPSAAFSVCRNLLQIAGSMIEKLPDPATTTGLFEKIDGSRHWTHLKQAMNPVEIYCLKRIFRLLHKYVNSDSVNDYYKQELRDAFKIVLVVHGFIDASEFPDGLQFQKMSAFCNWYKSRSPYSYSNFDHDRHNAEEYAEKIFGSQIIIENSQSFKGEDHI